MIFFTRNLLVLEMNTSIINLYHFPQLSSALASMQSKMSSAAELSAKNQLELKTDLTDTKHKLLDVQHQLNMAEKVI